VIESSESVNRTSILDWNGFSLDIILASNSPRRKTLLGFLGWSFDVVPADVDEAVLPGENPKDYVLRLAESKARAVAEHWGANAVIISADTTVVDEDEILGKPIDAEDAAHMLRRLRGRKHQVYTGLAVHYPTDVLLTDLGFADVPMRDYTEEEMHKYIASGDPLDKAGAYAIQHDGFQPVETLKACYANVVGLPLCHLTRTLRKVDLNPNVNVPEVCQSRLGYQCPVYNLILREEL